MGGWGLNEMYDPSTNTWTNLQPVPTSRVYFGTAAYQNKIYVIGGQDQLHYPWDPSKFYVIEVVTGVNEVYDPATGTWENKTSMPTPRNHLQANLVGGKIYLIGGQTQQPLDDPSAEHTSDLTEVYDPATDSWTTMAPIPNPVYGYASAVMDEQIYIISGWNPNASLSNLVQIFNPKTNIWSLGKSIPTPVRDASAGATSGVAAQKRIYVIGGSADATRAGGEHGTNLTQVYDPEADAWSKGADMPTERWGLAVAVTNDKLYAMGGASISLTDANEQYTPIGYGTVTPPPSTTPTQTPTPIATQTPTPTQTTSTAPPASQQPAEKPENPSVNIWLAIGAAVAVAVVAVASVYALRRRNKQ
jgi:N-acetylneuraminic acid mutarotase